MSKPVFNGLFILPNRLIWSGDLLSFGKFIYKWSADNNYSINYRNRDRFYRFITQIWLYAGSQGRQMPFRYQKKVSAWIFFLYWLSTEIICYHARWVCYIGLWAWFLNNRMRLSKLYDYVETHGVSYQYILL